MAIVLSGISVPLDADDNVIKNTAAKKMGLEAVDIKLLRVKKQSLDCRKKDIRLVYTLQISLFDDKMQQNLEEKLGRAEQYKEPQVKYGEKDPGRPLVVGAGPCGLFAALTLAKHGYMPLLIERGSDLSGREKDVARLLGEGVLNEESNVCFGAGGAGAFSDGKLTTRIKDKRAEYILETLVSCGAPEEILYAAKPHMGTEHIRAAVTCLIGKIKELGGEVLFNCRLSGILVPQGELRGVTYIKNGLHQKAHTRALILAVGRSARDTYDMLYKEGIALSSKAFAIGLRIEHKREAIDRAQYGEAFSNPMLGAAEYNLVSGSGGRGVYTFCMCPGGQVICSATEQGGVAVNGMSYYERSGDNSNSAIVVSVGPQDFCTGELGGVEFQRKLERAAYSKGFGASVQKLGDFMQGRVSSGFGEVMPSYRPYTVFRDLNECLPDFAANALKEGIRHFADKLNGFDMPDAVLTGVETRTSSPVRILRKPDCQAARTSGLFPAGEGAGYAGGIVSSAVDGIKCAQALMGIYRRP